MISQAVPDSGFCVACGCNNDTALQERKAAAVMEANRRQTKAKALSKFFRAFWILGRRA